MMCHRPAELICIPIVALMSICLHSFSMTQERWLTAYTEHDLIYATISPCYVCALDCPGCYEVTGIRSYDVSKVVKSAGEYYNAENHQDYVEGHLEFICFWMSDWDSTGFDSLSVVQHLQYWSIGTTMMAFILSVVSCVDRRGRLCCSSECTRPMLVLVIISAFLSVGVACLFSTAELTGLDNLLPDFTSNGVTQGDYSSPTLLAHNYTRLEWPFYIHISGVVLNTLLVVLALLYEMRSKQREAVNNITDDEKEITILTLDTDDIEEYQDLL